MALGFSRTLILSTDKKYLFLEDYNNESDGHVEIMDLFTEYKDQGLQYSLGSDEDKRFPLTPVQLLTFNTEMEN